MTALLTTHIQQAVPVLTAAQEGDQEAPDKALADWYANAEQIAPTPTPETPWSSPARPSPATGSPGSRSPSGGGVEGGGRHGHSAGPMSCGMAAARTR